MVVASPHDLLIGAFRAGVDAVRAEAILPPHLPPHLPTPGRGRNIVVAAGKAAAAMAACLEAHWPGHAPLEGLAITRHGHGAPTRRIEVVEADHPLPDAAGLAAAERLLALLAEARPEDQVIALLSGGGSSLLSLPAAGLGLADLQAVGRALLLSGAPIAAINCVRKHLSRTLGGRLAQICRAPVSALLLSDVAGDDPAVIASGPFAPDPTTYADADAILLRWGVAAPETVRRHLARGMAGEIAETPKPGDPCFARVETRVIGNGHTMLEGAAAHLARTGMRAVILGDTFTGEAREVAQVFAALAREIRTHGGPWQAPVVLLSGGETSVTVRAAGNYGGGDSGPGRGHGGRNAEFLLALALALDGLPGVHALAADSDGIDGTEDNAGALLGPDTLSRARDRGLDARTHLADNDSYGFFAALGDLLLTGPTRTNANDFRAVLIA
jgi:glycerate 2-kinase